MPYRADMLISSFKFTASLFGAGSLWFAQTVTAPSGSGSIDWIERYGITGGIIVTLVAVVKILFGMVQRQQSEALAAKDAQLKAAADNAAIHLATSEKLIDATIHQTNVIEKFGDRIDLLDKKVASCAGNQINQFPFNRKQDATQPLA